MKEQAGASCSLGKNSIALSLEFNFDSVSPCFFKFSLHICQGPAAISHRNSEIWEVLLTAIKMDAQMSNRFLSPPIPDPRRVE